MIILNSSFVSTAFVPLHSWYNSSTRRRCTIICQGKDVDQRASEILPEQSTKEGRREIVLKTSISAVLAALLNFSGKRPDYLGVQKSTASLALCPPTPTCISTAEQINDQSHYVPPWNYNPQDGRGRKNPVSREQAMAELIDVVKGSKPDNFTPKIVKATDDYLYVEYQSSFLGLVHDVEFWFRPGMLPIVEYRSASRVGNSDSDINRKRIKVLRQALEKKGWESVGF